MGGPRHSRPYYDAEKEDWRTIEGSGGDQGSPGSIVPYASTSTATAVLHTGRFYCSSHHVADLLPVLLGLPRFLLLVETQFNIGHSFHVARFVFMVSETVLSTRICVLVYEFLMYWSLDNTFPRSPLLLFRTIGSFFDLSF